MAKPSEASKPSGRSRAKSAVARRDDLMNAAETLFLRQGAGPTTIEQITTAAGVGKGSFYLHFGCKNDLVVALRERLAKLLVHRAAHMMGSSTAGDWKAKLASWAEAAVDSCLASLPLHDTVFHELPPRSWHDTSTSIVVDHLAAVLTAGAREGAWSLKDAHFTAVVLFSGLHGIIDNLLDTGAPVDRQRLVEQFQAVCFRAVGIHSALGSRS